MWRRKRTDQGGSPRATADLARAEREAAEQRAKLEAEMPLMAKLRDIRAANHLSDELYQVLSARRNEQRRGPA